MTIYELYLYKGINSHDGHVGLTLGIVHQVEVHQLFQFQVVCLHAVHDIGEQGAETETRCHFTADSWCDVLQYNRTSAPSSPPDIFANCHRCYDLLHSLLLLLFLITVQLCLELKDLPFEQKKERKNERQHSVIHFSSGGGKEGKCAPLPSSHHVRAVELIY